MRPEEMSMENSSDTIGNRTRDLPTCSAVPQPTAPPRAPVVYVMLEISEALVRLSRNVRVTKIVKVKWSRYRPGVAQTVGRGIALLFHDRGTRRGWRVGSSPRPHITPRERPGTHCKGGWVGPRAGLDGRKISSPPVFDPGPSSP